MFQDSPVPAGSAQAQPGAGWMRPDGPAGPERRTSVKMLAVTAALALAAGAGTTWALTSGTVTGPVLTTAQVVSKTDPGVVDVISTLGDQGGTAYGTGIVLTSDGVILTNNHVIDGATSVQVRAVGNGRIYQATVVGYSEHDDLAVLQLKDASGLTTATLGNSSGVSVGEKVIAIGNAEGRDSTPSVATGTVTALNRSITASDESSGISEQLTGLIQTNADIQPGDSGGPLTNTYGQVVGLDTAALTGSSWQFSSTSATQAYTIPINEALSVARQIEAGSSSATVHIGATAFLGVEVSGASNAAGSSGTGGSSGAGVVGVVSGSAVATAGLTGGDTITSLAGQTITSSSQIRTVLTQYHPGDKIGISWTDQQGDSHSATIVLGSGPAG
jgi:S1-C subfamily serine protease